jgi:XRE family transcriptional regulator, fatty acid utilization regulator
MPIHDRLKYARQRAGLTGTQVRERADIGESSLSDFENGKREPSLSQLQKLAGVYRRSVAFFLADGPVAPEPAVLWRMRPSKDAEEIEVRFLRLCEQYHNLEVWCDEHIPSCLPRATGDASLFDFRRTKVLAKEVRDHLQLGDRPGQSLLRVLEEVCAVKVFHLPFEPTGTAASTKSETFGPAILLNSVNARWRRNFDLAHELFHLLTWELFRHSTDASSALASEQEERLANCFASHVLMPAEILRLTVEQYLTDAKGTLPVDAVFNIARQFDVSVDALMWQIHSLFPRHADAETTKRQIEHIKAFAPLFEERDQLEPPTWPVRYHALAAKAFRKGELSTGRFAEYLNISRQEAMRFVEQEIPDGEEVQVTTA